jgi:hypothetical protein
MYATWFAAVDDDGYVAAFDTYEVGQLPDAFSAQFRAAATVANAADSEHPPHAITVREAENLHESSLGHYVVAEMGRILMLLASEVIAKEYEELGLARVRRSSIRDALRAVPLSARQQQWLANERWDDVLAAVLEDISFRDYIALHREGACLCCVDLEDTDYRCLGLPHYHYSNTESWTGFCVRGIRDDHYPYMPPAPRHPLHIDVLPSTLQAVFAALRFQGLCFLETPMIRLPEHMACSDRYGPCPG